MIEFAGRQFDLLVRDERGVSQREHLAAVQRATGEAPPQLLERPPAALALIWRWFCELSPGRQYAGMGEPLPLSWAEIAAWSALSGARPTSSQVALIRRLDACFLERQAKNRKE